MKLIVGLGNPDKEYDNTRHNIGFRYIDNYANSMNVTINKNKFNGLFQELNINNEKVFLLDENNNVVTSQVLKEESDIDIDRRKRLVLKANLPALGSRKFGVHLDIVDRIPAYEDKGEEIVVEDDGNRNYWWLNANPKIWSFSDIEINLEDNLFLHS